MAIIMGDTRGSFTVLKMPIESSIVRIDGFDPPNGQNDHGILVQSFSMKDAEKHSIIQCFNDSNHVYAFGHDPEQSGFAITYIVFFGSQCMPDKEFKQSNYLETIVGKYNELRVSSSSKTVNVIYGNGVMQEGILLSLSASIHDPELNTISVTLSGKAMQSINV
jgi:hypothetical protein